MMKMSRRTLLKGAAVAAMGTFPRPGYAEERLNIYWGDLHCHSNLSYGEGDPEEGLKAAREHLDFATITAHAAWPDMPEEKGRLAWVRDYHKTGFAKARRGWPGLRQMMKRYRVEGKFIPFVSYEWHNMKYGDRTIVYRDLDGALVLPDTLEELTAQLKGRNAMIIPHHMGYQTGYRGMNWNYFTPELTPLVEISSKHGCSETDYAPYPMLHDMGPRVGGGTALAGLERGYHFGFIASSDNHSGFPGSYGEGRLAVYAKSLTARDLWEAFYDRRTYAATGDRIQLAFDINGQAMGRLLPNVKEKEISVRVHSEDFIEYVDIVRNGVTIKRLNGVFPGSTSRREAMHVKFRVEWGWGEKAQMIAWNGECRISDGRILKVTPYFRGQLLLAPRQDHEKDQKPFTPIHQIRNLTDRSFDFRSYTYGNPNTRTPATCSAVVEAEMPINGRVRLNLNGKRGSYALAELLGSTQADFIRGWLSEAVQIHRAVPIEACNLQHTFKDATADPAYYYARVVQYNGQLAWSSPIRFTTAVPSQASGGR